MIDDIHPHWHQNPLVLRAVENSNGTPHGVLTELHQIMLDVEDRFPGVPFAQLLSDPAQRPDMRRMRGTLRRGGACEADIALVCPSTKDREVQNRWNALTKGDPYADEAVRL